MQRGDLLKRQTLLKAATCTTTINPNKLSLMPYPTDHHRIMYDHHETMMHHHYALLDHYHTLLDAPHEKARNDARHIYEHMMQEHHHMVQEHQDMMQTHEQAGQSQRTPEDIIPCTTPKHSPTTEQTPPLELFTRENAPPQFTSLQVVVQQQEIKDRAALLPRHDSTSSTHPETLDHTP